MEKQRLELMTGARCEKAVYSQIDILSNQRYNDDARIFLKGGRIVWIFITSLR